MNFANQMSDGKSTGFEWMQERKMKSGAETGVWIHHFVQRNGQKTVCSVHLPNFLKIYLKYLLHFGKQFGIIEVSCDCAYAYALK